MDIKERCNKITLLLLDVDGVLTDGRLYFGPQGEALKAFFVRDGQGLKFWHQSGFRSGIISGRRSEIVELRGGQLGVEFIEQDWDEKHLALKKIVAQAGVKMDECAFVGDDTPDIEVMERVGLAVAVADAHEKVKQAAHYVTRSDGGRGAVREVIDLLLVAKSSS